MTPPTSAPNLGRSGSKTVSLRRTRRWRVFVWCEALERRVVLSAAPGSLNPSFGGNGIAVAGAAFTQLNALASLPGGKEVVVGQANNGFGLEKLNADGSLDRSFGSGTGVVTTLFAQAGGDVADAVAGLPGGKILAAGQAGGGSGGFAVARYNPDGSLDKSFGSGGLVRTSFGGSDTAAAIALMLDGSFVLAGTDQFDLGGGNTGERFALARYNANGSLDKTFGAGGKVTTDFGNHGEGADAVLVTPAGTVYVAGSASDAAGNPSFALAKYMPSGRLDKSFNHGTGFVTTSFGPGFQSGSGVAESQATVITLGRDGKITLAGTVVFVSDFDGSASLALVRYEADGTPDAGFGTDGVLFAGGGVNLVTGVASAVPGGGYVYADSADVLRFDAKGSPVASFRYGGYNPLLSGRQITAVGVTSDGKVLVVGDGVGPEALPGTSAAVARFNADGSIDRSFNPGGGYTVVPIADPEALELDGTTAPANAEALLPNRGHPDRRRVRTGLLK